MEIKTRDNTTLKKELELLLQYIQERCTTEYMQEWQEYFITVIYLLTNSSFREKIVALRNKYNIPEEWYTTDTDASTLFYKWYYARKSNPPEDPTHPVIDELCLKCNVNPVVMRTFVFDYLYFGVVYPKKSPDEYQVGTKSEFRYKSRLEAFVDNGNVNTIELSGNRGYIRFYKDTDIADIHNFIDANTKAIYEIKRGLDPYPSYIKTNRYNKIIKNEDGKNFKLENFKRDIQIYILHLLRQIYSKEERINKKLEKQKNIADRLYNDNFFSEEDLQKKKGNFQNIFVQNREHVYTINNNKISKVVKDIDLQLQRFNK